ncbi:protein kinase shaggy-related [Anaeramoeba flamelloides]|uniref:Protein kinase shaggy-related n=1 Tax=Anaeramoeba flamelloides TaxID=1746091 RepID=A0AAV7ZIT0_9EUKA|nr:protein kinase shaggy-related [Anaeramoeba flamelloides]
MSVRCLQKPNENYQIFKLLGKGSFGVVHKARSTKKGHSVAIKTVFLDKRYHNRELQIMKKLKHRNIIKLENYFYSQKDSTKDVYLHLVMEYIPKTISQLTQYHQNQLDKVPMILVKVHTYQLCRAVAKLHRMDICHRDIKPENILISPSTSELRLCDFGSAKILKKGEKSTSYICSRYYRAPELIFGATEYKKQIDLWSIGCVLAELFMGRPIFRGKSVMGQLVEIIKVLGTPTESELTSMNKNYSNFNLPKVEPKNLKKLFGKRIPDEGIDLVSKFLKYNPNARINPLEACAHPFFDQLRDPNTKLPNKTDLPELFDFDSEELNSVNDQIKKKLIPQHLR